MKWLFFLTLSASLSAEIILHNRPLAKLHGKTFSVMDVKKKMDFFLKEHNPSILENEPARYQFYTQNWRSVLQEFINNELIKMEAENFKLPISDGDVREEMEKRFGPNLVARLDQLGLSYEEAKEMIRDELIVRNISWYRIWNKVLQEVTPELIKTEYSEFVTEKPKNDTWTYKMVSLRGDQATEQAASLAYDILMKKQDLITMSSKEIAPEVLQVLERLPVGGVSEPVLQKSRSDGSNVYRLFCVVEHKPDTPPTL